MTCTTCPFFSALDTTCRFNPPLAALINTPQGPAPSAYFPPARPEHWCGEHPERKAAAKAGRTILAERS